MAMALCCIELSVKYVENKQKNYVCVCVCVCVKCFNIQPKRGFTSSSWSNVVKNKNFSDVTQVECDAILSSIALRMNV